MIGPVSGTGRAMMASLQQAISKGMPPDQAVQYVKSMATQGVAPLTDLYSMLNQFQRLKQQQVKPPQTPPTIKDQLNMLDQQQQMQPQQGNIQQMQAGAPAPQAMDRGLGAIDAGRMEYPQFAGGGIVAFAGGGDVIHMADGPPPSMFDNAIGAVKDFAGPYIDTAKDFGSAYMTALRNPFGSIASTEVAETLSQSPEFSNENEKSGNNDTPKLSYRIQIGAFKQARSEQTDFRRNSGYKIVEERMPNNFYRYLTEDFYNLENTQLKLNTLIKKGYDKAFIVPYYDNNRLNMSPEQAKEKYGK